VTNLRRRRIVRRVPGEIPGLPESVKIILPRHRKINPWHVLWVLAGLSLLAGGGYLGWRKLQAPEPEPEPQVEMREVEVTPPLPEPEPDLEADEQAEPDPDAAPAAEDLLARSDAPADPGNAISLDLALGTGGDGMAVSAGGGGGGRGSRFAYEPGQVDKEPEVSQDSPPEIPRKAAEQGVSGSFIATFVVGATGRVESIQITGGPQGYGYEDAIRKALQKRRYKPAMAGGVAVAMKIRQPFDFRLE
jgi:TonB family protein